LERKVMKEPRITTVKARIAVIFLIAAGFALWQVQYGHADDLKDLRYQAWRLGLYPMDLDQATSTMVGDMGPDRLVVGKSLSLVWKRNSGNPT